MIPRTARMVTPWACLFMLLAFAGTASAQTGKLTGSVRDQATGEPLAGAQVFLEGTGRGTLTQENGRYFVLNIEPGTYTVVAQLIGYGTLRFENVQIAIDVTRTLDFDLQSEAVALQEITVVSERTPLVQRGQSGSVDLISAEEISALPVSDIIGVLSLEQGFIHVPVDNTEVVTFAQQRQGVTPLRIRGGRGAETTVLIDGIPINNFVLGGPALDISNKAIEQIAFLRGYFDAQYGNALSGVINYATREGSREFEGEVEYRSSAPGGWLGNEFDETRAFDMLEGYVSGPVPGTGEKLRFMVSGRQRYGAHRALQFDDDVFRPSTPSTSFNSPDELDLIPGWRSFGFDEQRDVYSKLSYFVTPAAKLNLSWVSYQRQNQPYDRDWMLDVDPLPLVTTAEDSAFYLARATTLMRFRDLVPASLDLRRDLFIAKWNHTLGNTAYTATFGYFDQNRETCNFFSGVCLEAHFEDPNFDGSFVAPGPAPYANTPTTGTDFFWGGEQLKTMTGRFDVQSQVSDHHNLSAGLFFQQHDLLYDEWENKGTNDVITVRQHYESDPWDGAFYLQDKIEYDFLTLNLGARFDYGKASGLFFANPVDPTNGTTAVAVCASPGEWQNRSVRRFDEATGQVVTETLSANSSWTQQSCGDPAVRAEAARIATADDFAEADARTQFSPRIGVSIPVTESSQLFFNFGRYSQNPILKNTYQNTGIGTEREGTPSGPALFSSVYRTSFLGNPHLLTEQATTYEIGYSQEVGNLYALSGVVYSKDQSGLTGIAQVGQFPFIVSDPGVTYGSSTPGYSILINRDFATTRGLELSFRRRVQDHWGFDVNYGFMQCRTNAADPEREFERVDDEADPEIRQEIPCEIDQPHKFTGVLRFAVGEDAPDVPLGNLLRHTNASLVLNAMSGFPYTPTFDFAGTGELGQADRFSGQAPSILTIDLLARKDWAFNNMRYGLFVLVENLTDRENCAQVFPTTGNCIGGGEDQNRRRAGNQVGTNTSSTFFDRPEFLLDGRSIEAGLRVSF